MMRIESEDRSVEIEVKIVVHVSGVEPMGVHNWSKTRFMPDTVKLLFVDGEFSNCAIVSGKQLLKSGNVSDKAIQSRTFYSSETQPAWLEKLVDDIYAREHEHYPHCSLKALAESKGR